MAGGYRTSPRPRSQVPGQGPPGRQITIAKSSQHSLHYSQLWRGGLFASSDGCSTGLDVRSTVTFAGSMLCGLLPNLPLTSQCPISDRNNDLTEPNRDYWRRETILH